MSTLAPLVLAASAAVFVWHLVRPNVRDLRVSMARFLPDLTPSRAARFRISPVPPMTSVPFLLRLLLLALVILAFWPGLLPQLPPAPQASHLRIVLDRSPSAVIGGREAQALAAVTRLMAAAEGNVCIDLVAVDGAGEVLVLADPAAALAEIPVAREGMPASALFRPLARAIAEACPGIPSQAAIVSDLPPQPVPDALFAGPVVWWQVGEPAGNLAISDLRVTGCALCAEAPRVEVLVQGYGWTGTAPALSFVSAGAERSVPLAPDPLRENGWIGLLPFPGDGEHSVALAQNDALENDNRLGFSLRAIERLAVEWRLPNPSRPAALVEGGAADLLVTALNPAATVPEDRPVVLVYPARPDSADARIGYFRQDHPILDGVSFDVLERHLPLGLTDLPAGFEPVLRRDGPGAPVVIALRQQPRGVILPAPEPGGAGRDVSLVLFANTLRWVGAEAATGALDLRHLDRGGAPVESILLESDTARPLAPEPDLATLADPSAQAFAAEATPLTPWLLLVALLVLLIERTLGVYWRPAR